MSDQSQLDVTTLLMAWGNGDEDALARLTALVHDELHRLAERYMRREHAGHTRDGPRPPFEVGRTDVTSISPCTVSPTRTGLSTCFFNSSRANPVPWIMLWQSSPSTRL